MAKSKKPIPVKKQPAKHNFPARDKNGRFVKKQIATPRPRDSNGRFVSTVKPIVRVSQIRSILWNEYGNLFKQYEDTAAVASLFYKQFGNKIPDASEFSKFVKKFVKEAEKRPPAGAPPIGGALPEKPVVTEISLGKEEYYFDIDERMSSLKNGATLGNYIVRSDISQINEFLVKEYKYSSTFQKYVDELNEVYKKEKVSGYDEIKIIFDLEYDETIKAWYFIVYELGSRSQIPSAGIPAGAPPIIPQEDKQLSGLNSLLEIQKEMLKSMKSKKQKKAQKARIVQTSEKIKQLEQKPAKPTTTQRKAVSAAEQMKQLKVIEAKIKLLKQEVDIVEKNMLKYKKMKATKQYKEAMAEWNDLLIALRDARRELINLKK